MVWLNLSLKKRSADDFSCNLFLVRFFNWRGPSLFFIILSFRPWNKAAKRFGPKAKLFRSRFHRRSGHSSAEAGSARRPLRCVRGHQEETHGSQRENVRFHDGHGGRQRGVGGRSLGPNGEGECQARHYYAKHAGEYYRLADEICISKRLWIIIFFRLNVGRTDLITSLDCQQSPCLLSMA